MSAQVNHEGMAGPLRRHDRWRTRGFTLVELLVVTALIALLLALVIPAAQQAGRKARAVACQGQLRQCDLGLTAFVDEQKGPGTHTTGDEWYRFYRSYGDPSGNVFLCPMAGRYETNLSDPHWTAREQTGCGLGSQFTAWRLTIPTTATLEQGQLLGGYALNGFGLMYLDMQIHGGRKVALSNVPVFLDSVSWVTNAVNDAEPPQHEGQLSHAGIKESCIDRHGGGIHSLFLDWSVRKFGLKELWTLDWSPRFDPQNAWTRAGGVQPEDWPQWMRKFKDY
jgi:prepilin-type N-terminal cleavage/methylation domain-containing protein/prepilin-type processing-associated H-X9-DG protein